MTTRHADHPIDPRFLQRWSPRAFTGEAIDEATLRGLLEAARWAPSASNQQPWRFLYGRAGTPAFQRLFDTLAPGNQAWAGRASALIAVLSRQTTTPPGQDTAQPNRWHSFDAGAAWMSLALQAQAAGWAVHAMGGFSVDALRAALEVPGDVTLEAVVAVGRQGDPAMLSEALQARETPNSRLPLAALAAEGVWRFEG